MNDGSIIDLVLNRSLTLARSATEWSIAFLRQHLVEQCSLLMIDGIMALFFTLLILPRGSECVHGMIVLGFC